MKTKTFINQFFTLIMCIVMLTVSGGKFWSEKVGQQTQQESKTALKDPASSRAASSKADSKETSSKVPAENAVVSELSLNAVITPSLSFDFFQGFYILPEPVWHVVENSVKEISSHVEPHFLVTSFCRLFACYIVTNAP